MQVVHRHRRVLETRKLTIDRIAQISKTDICRHNSGTMAGANGGPSRDRRVLERATCEASGSYNRTGGELSNPSLEGACTPDWRATQNRLLVEGDSGRGRFRTGYVRLLRRQMPPTCVLNQVGPNTVPLIHHDPRPQVDLTYEDWMLTVVDPNAPLLAMTGPGLTGRDNR